MTYLLWHRQGDTRIGAPSLVLRAADVPPLQQAHQLCERLARLHGEEAGRIEAATAAAASLGRAQGLEEGRRLAREELGAALAQLARQGEEERTRQRAELGALALQVARKLLGRHAEDRLLAALAATAVEDALPARQFVLSVHPAFADAVRERLAALPDAPAFEVRADGACARDACRIETEHGSIDAGLQAQLARLAEAWGANPLPQGEGA